MSTSKTNPASEAIPQFDVSLAERQALFIAASLEVIFQTLPDDAIDNPVSVKFLIGNLAVMAQQLGVALQNEDTSRLMPHTIGEVE